MEYMKLARKVAEVEQKCIDNDTTGKVIIYIDKYGVKKIVTEIDEKD